MPELPEVETIVSELRPLLVGRSVAGLHALWAGTLGGVDPNDFAARLADQKITGLGRRGKYILIYLDGGDVLVIHLRMTGRLFLSPADAEPDRYTRVVIDLAGGEELRFADLRKFGRMVLAPADDLVSALPRLGPEPLGDAYPPEEMARTMGSRRSPVKSVLLNQQLLAGMGNIYADEALFLARIHPLRRADTLSEEEWRRLHAGVQATLANGIKNRGTSFRDYRDGRNQKGSNQETLAVYRRTGQPCPECGTPIERVVVGGRSSHFCPKCQGNGGG
jgi:formamidopyrimidine-DNA glycosylase